jgi:hypothetical protein
MRYVAAGAALPYVWSNFHTPELAASVPLEILTPQTRVTPHVDNGTIFEMSSQRKGVHARKRECVSQCRLSLAARAAALHLLLIA